MRESAAPDDDLVRKFADLFDTSASEIASAILAIEAASRLRDGRQLAN